MNYKTKQYTSIIFTNKGVKKWRGMTAMDILRMKKKGGFRYANVYNKYTKLFVKRVYPD